LKKTFEHLLGLNAKDALAILKSAGIFDVRVTFTSAPAPLRARPGADSGDDQPKRSALSGIAGQFSVSDEDGEPAYDPLLEPELTDGMLTEARVIGVRDDGRRLIVSRFRVSPKR
jgi:hypothetical protein